MTKARMSIGAIALVLVALVGLIFWQEHRPRQRAQNKTDVPEKQPYHYTQQQSMFFIERLNFGKRVGLALLTIAKESGGQLPPDLTSAASWLATNEVPIQGDVGPMFGIGVTNFELIYKGNLSNLKNSSETILARERDPVEVHAGRWTRMYVFADGSVYRLEATTADGFPAREKEVWPNQPR
jgi:hypothetical protein